ncbi:ArgS-related anticodon-binding protein NrtL [Streptomyces sp. NPDC056500]|uniref:ArgS-related anticodon-binding protein NrtL n=1 Tax=Streptomyces sp. NPDC056500 TaxID=3345840 RepID=UPI00368A9D4B
MTPADLSRTVLHAVHRAVQDGVLSAPVPERVSVERPRPGGRGDYATNVALRLAGPAGQPPRAVAETLRARIVDDSRIASVEITGPGFLNITLRAGAQQALVRRVLEQGIRYGHRDGQDDQRDPRPLLAVPPVQGEGDLRARLWAQSVQRLRATQGFGQEFVAETGSLDASGPDVPYDDETRWAMLSVAAHDHPRPPAHFLPQREDNPLFQVRYAHSRARALTRNAAALGFVGVPDEQVDTPLAQLVEDHPAVLASAARLGAPDRLARHLEATADALLDFQHCVLPLGDEKPMAAHRSRLALAEAAGTVLAGGLSLLGISAPVHL